MLVFNKDFLQDSTKKVRLLIFDKLQNDIVYSNILQGASFTYKRCPHELLNDCLYLLMGVH